MTALEAVFRELLPEDYRDPKIAVSSAPMKSAGLQFDAEGRVAWNRIWRSFCDLAIAGGPPHKGRLLEAGRPAELETHRAEYEAVVAEICRGITMTTGLPAAAGPDAGWVRVTCPDAVMASWLLRAIVMENVAVRADGATLELPAAPGFRLDREIKNVVTVMAKTCHYWTDHMSAEQHETIGTLLVALEEQSPLIVPGSAADEVLRPAIAGRLETVGLPVSAHSYSGWLGVQCADQAAAIRMMQMLVASNILARREETTLFVPLNRASDADGEAVASSVEQVHALIRAVT